MGVGVLLRPMIDYREPVFGPLGCWGRDAARYSVGGGESMSRGGGNAGAEKGKTSCWPCEGFCCKSSQDRGYIYS